MSIRLRLALLYALVLAIALVLSNLLVYGLMSRHFQQLADESVARDADHFASTISATSGGVDASTGLHNLLLPSLDAFASPGAYVQVVGPDGGVLARSSNLGGDEVSVPAVVLESARAGSPSYLDVSVGADPVRVYVEPLRIGGSTLVLVEVARSYREDDATLASLRLAMLGVGLLSLLGTGVLSWAMASRALQPVSALTRTAEEIAESRGLGLSRRVPNAESRDELGHLARTLNEMLDSLEEAYSSQQRFVADASHELRTPLTVIQGNLDLLRNKGDVLPREERAALGDAAWTEAERMSRLVADLLALARADAGQAIARRPVELDRVLLEVYQEARVLNRQLVAAVDRLAHAAEGDSSGVPGPDCAQHVEKIGLRISELDQLRVTGDPDRLRQLLLALVDNALKYTPPGGAVSLGLRCEGAWAVLEVSDTGIGIAPEDLSRDLRALLPGRQGTEPRPRRDRARALHRRLDRQGARRGDTSRERARQGQHVHGPPTAARGCGSAARGDSRLRARVTVVSVSRALVRQRLRRRSSLTRWLNWDRRRACRSSRRGGESRARCSSRCRRPGGRP